MKNKALFTILAGSIAQLLHGATIESNSPVTGDWSNPNSWLGNTVPDTYLFDSVIIHSGDSIDYDSGVSTPDGLVGPGGLSIAGGQFITIDGGVLTQSTIGNEIRIGEGSSGSGDGILTISNGGSFNSGAALAVAVGVSLGGGPGSGVVNLDNGTFTMGAGATLGGLAVGVDGSTGAFNIGTGAGSPGSAVLDLATNNIGLGIGYFFAGPAGGTGTVTINNDGLLNLGTTGIAVGTGGGNATLTINGGTLAGVASGGGGITVGDGAGTTGTLTITNSGTLTNSGELRIGSDGGTGSFTMNSGTLNLANGGGFAEFNVGRGALATGTAAISGGVVSVGDTFIGRDGGTASLVFSNSTLTSSGTFFIGNNGSGDAVLSSGTITTAGQFVVGANGSGLGTLTITNGSITTGSQFDVGQNSAANNVVTISGGSITSGNEIRIGEGIGANGTMNISGTANIVANGEFQTGNDGGNGVVNMSGGTLTANSWFALGRTGGNGIFNLSGGTIIKGTSANTGTLDISTFHNGAGTTTMGTMNQTGGDIVNTVSDTNIARDVGNVGIWNMQGGTANLANFHIGNDGTGTMNIGGTDPVSVTTSGQIEVGANGTALGILNISNPNAVINVGTEMQLGRNGSRGEVHQSAGVVNAHGGWFGLANDGTNPSALYELSGGQLNVSTTMEVGAEGVGELIVSGNGALTAQNIHAGQRGNGTGILTFSDNASVTVSNQIVVGFGSANANVANVSGGTISSGTETVVGQGVGNIGTLNLIGPATWTSGGEFQVGNDGGTGVANITDGTIIALSYVAIGRNTNGNNGLNGANGTVNMSGGTLRKVNTNGGSFDVGSWNGGIDTTNTSGTLNQTGGAVEVFNSDSHIGRDTGVVGVYNLSGGSYTQSGGNLNVGQGGHGTFDITGGTVSANVNEFRVANFGGSTGLINVGGVDTFTLVAGANSAVGQGGGVGTMNITNPNANLTFNAEFWVGNGTGNGTLNMNAGTIIANSWFDLGRDSGIGVVNFGGGSIIKQTGLGQLNIGSSGTGQGTFNQTGGSITNLDADTLVARDPSTVGTWNVTGGTATLAGLRIGATGHGTVNVTGTDAVTITARDIRIGGEYGNTGNGILNISNPNAVITGANEMGTGRNGGHGEVHQSAGVLNAGGGWFGIANDGAGVTGLYDISGGQLNAPNATMELGADGVGEFRATGTAQVSFQNIHVSQRTGGTGTLTIADNAVVTASQQIVVGFGSANANVANVSGGTISSGSETVVGQGINGGIPNVGTLNINGPASWTSGGEIQVGNDGGTGVLNMSDGTLTALSYVAIGRNTGNNGGANGGNGTVNLSGGTISKVNTNGGSFDVGSWNGGNAATTNTTGTLNQTGGNVVVTNSDTHIGRDTGVVGIWNLSGGTFTQSGGNLNVGQGGNGTFTITGGTVSASINEFRVANFAGSTGLINIGGTDAFTLVAGANSAVGQGGGLGTMNITNPNTNLTFNAEFWVGNGTGNGTLNMDAGSIVANSWFDLGRDNGIGVVNLNGGSITKVTNLGQLNIGSSGNGQGTLNQLGGTITNTDADTLIARDGATVGVWNMQGGTATLARLHVGNDGNGTLNLTDGVITANDHVSIAANGSATGLANLDGGTLATRWVEAGAGIATLNFNGGTLRALGNEGDFLRNINTSNSEVLAGGAVFDTSGFDVTVNNQFDGVGGLVKNGEGNLTVTNATNANTGGTIVNRGNIIYPVISAAGPGGVDILINAPGAAALDGTDLNPLLARTITTSNGAIALHNNTSATNLDFTAYPSLSLGSVGTSSFGNLLTPGGGNYRLGGGGGTLTVSTVLADSGGPTGLIVNGNGLTGTVVLTSLESYTGATNVAGGTLVLAGGTNTLPTTTTLTIGGTGTVDLNGLAQTVASLSGAVGSNLTNTGAASVFTFGGNNANAIYDGLITGPISMVKVGTGIQTISAPQTYTALSVTAGQVVLGGSNHLQSLSIADGTKVTLSAHAGGPANNKIIETNALTLSGANPQLDLTNNVMVVHGGNYASLRASVITGFNGGLWDGPGINSTSAATDPTLLTAIAIVDNNDAGFSDFYGVTTGATDVLFKYTYVGDNDLNGIVNLDDFGLFQDGRSGALPPSWFSGDYDYNGVVNLDDFGLFQDGRNLHGPALREESQDDPGGAIAQALDGGDSGGGDGAIAEAGNGLLGDGGNAAAGDGLAAGPAGRAVVPEPGSIGLLAVGALGLLARRRRPSARS